jgi:hypothetical protein
VRRRHADAPDRRGGIGAHKRRRVGSGEALGLLLPRGQGLCSDIEFHGREGLEKRIHDPGIDRIGRHLVTHRGPILLAEGVPDGAGAPRILHDHLVAACPAGDEAVQEGVARARDPTGFVPVLLGVIVCEHRLHLERRRPPAGRWVDVREAEAPLRLGQPGEGGACRRRRRGWMRENGEHGGHTRRLPHESADAVTAG